MTYGALRFLSANLSSSMRLFEYGSGGSTAWLADRVHEVVSVEHDPEWFTESSAYLRADVRLVPCRGDWYFDAGDSQYVETVADGAPWDVIVIDGVARNTCAAQVHDKLNPLGLVVLDDTHNPLLRPAQASLAEQGFGRIDFWGLRPGSGYEGCTSVFSRSFDGLLLPGKAAPS